MEDRFEGVDRFALGDGHDLGAVLAVLVADPVDEVQRAAAVPELTREWVTGGCTAARCGALTVGARERAGTPGRADVQTPREQRRVQVLLQIGHPWVRARGVRELASEPSPPLHLGEQVGDVDPRRESVQLGAEANGRGVLVERVWT